MKIKLKKSILIKGQHFEAGVIHDVEESEALSLINGGRAIEAVEAPVIPPTPPKPKKAKVITTDVNTN